MAPVICWVSSSTDMVSGFFSQLYRSFVDDRYRRKRELVASQALAPLDMEVALEALTSILERRGIELLGLAPMAASGHFDPPYARSR